MSFCCFFILWLERLFLFPISVLKQTLVTVDPSLNDENKSQTTIPVAAKLLQVTGYDIAANAGEPGYPWCFIQEGRVGRCNPWELRYLIATNLIGNCLNCFFYPLSATSNGHCTIPRIWRINLSVASCFCNLSSSKLSVPGPILFVIWARYGLGLGINFLNAQNITCVTSERCDGPPKTGKEFDTRKCIFQIHFLITD